MANSSPQRTTVTAALLYANGPVHIGHLGGCYLPADIYVRFLRSWHGETPNTPLEQKRVLFVSGSDEHGVAITMKARQRGETPRETIDHFHPIIEEAFRAIGISFDIYSRTSDPIHHATAQAFFQRFYDRADSLGVGFEEKRTEQFFDPETATFLADRYILGTCPHCSYPRAYGDQCENCGNTLSPDELIEPRNALTGGALVKRPTTHWFLRLDAYQPALQQYVQYHQADWKPNVYGQASSWLSEGLQPRSMTRDLDWGIDLPEGIPGREGKKLYVWFDAPIGYISATQDWALRNGQPDAWKAWWLRTAPVEPSQLEAGITTANDAEPTRLIHFIGKDNIVFHTLIFPAMLMGMGEYLVPDNVPANEFVNLEGQKISTSRNHAVWLHEYVADFQHIPGGLDMLRYVMTSIAPEAKDSDFSWKDFQQRVNSELVAVLGNYVNRVLTLVQKYCDGIVPERGLDLTDATDAEFAFVLSEARACIQRIEQHVQAFRFKEGLAEVLNLARIGNVTLQQNAPWTLAKDPANAQRIRNQLHYHVQLCGMLAIAAEPFLPFTSIALHDLLAQDEPWQWPDLARGADLVPAGRQLPQPVLLFQKVEDAWIEAQLAKLGPPSPLLAKEGAGEVIQPVGATQSAAPSSLPPPSPPLQGGGIIAPLKEAIQYDDFAKLDIRVATIIAAERIPKADKLLKLTLRTNLPSDPGGVRTVVSGIAAHFQPEAILGQRVLVLANLAPRTMRGVESQGMILMAEDPATGPLVFVAPQGEAGDGSGVR